MSKRFGRNQRRKLLAQRDQLDRLATEMQTKWIEGKNEAYRLTQGIKDWNDRIGQMLDRTSAFLSEPAQRKVRDLQRYLPVEKRYGLMTLPPPEAETMARNFTVQTVFWNFLSVIAEDDVRTLRKINTLIQELPDGRKFYCRTDLDHMVLIKNTDRNDLAYFVARDLVRLWKEAPR